MVTEIQMETLAVGKYTTRNGREAVVDAVADGMLVGRYKLIDGHGDDFWVPKIWRLDGSVFLGLDDIHDIGREFKPHVRRTYWLNIYDNGPGLLRETWEQALVEASREEKQPLCRVEVKVEACVGDGLR
jgi:hypothetical protein